MKPMNSSHKSKKFLFSLFGLIFILSNYGSFTQSDYVGSVSVQNNDNYEYPLPHPSSTVLNTSSWSPIEEIYDSLVKTDVKPIIKVDSENNIHIVWVAEFAGDTSVGYIKYQYQSQNWSQIINFTIYSNPNNYSDQYPDLALSGTTAYVVWLRSSTTLWFSKIDSNLTYTCEAVSVPFYSGGIFIQPQIQINSSGDIVVVFRSSTGSTANIFGIVKNASNPTIWSQTFTIFDPLGTDYSFSSTTAVHRIYWDQYQKLHVFFISRYVDSIDRIFYLKNDYALQSSGSFNLSHMQNISYSTYASELRIEANSYTDYLYTTWNTNNSYIFVTNKTFTGEFNETVCFTNNYVPGTQNRYPAIAIDKENNVIVTWENLDIISRVRWVSNISSPVETFLDNTASGNPGLGISNNNDIIFIYFNKVNSHMNFRLFDRFGPNPIFLSPANEQVLYGNITIDIAVEPDTIDVQYYYKEAYNETLNSITNITQNPPPGQFAYNWTFPEEDKLNITIIAYVTDKHGLNASIQLTNITVDNNAPAYVNLTGIIDNFGNNASNTPFFAKGIVNISFSAYDNASGIQRVELWNGTQLITSTNPLISPNRDFILWQTNSSVDGNYSRLFLRAYDYGGKYLNGSFFLHPLIIDNTAPIIEFVTIAQGQEYHGIINILIVASPDTASIIVVTSDSITSPLYLAGSPGALTKVSNSNNWTISWDTTKGPSTTGYRVLNGEYTLNFTSVDVYGNTQFNQITIIIDNTAPKPRIILPFASSYVGYEMLFKAYSDDDTVGARIYYGKYFSGFESSYTNLNKNVTILNPPFNGTHNVIETTLNLFEFREKEDVKMGLVLVVWDNQGFITDNQYVEFYLKSSIPRNSSIYYLPDAAKITVNYDKKTFTVPVSFDRNSEDGYRYLIYRSLQKFDIQYLNSLEPNERLNTLGSKPGEKYCVGEVLDKNVIDSRKVEFYDQNVPGNNYYYIVLTQNEFNYTSNCSDMLYVRLSVNPPERGIDLNDFRAMPYAFGAMVAMMGIIAVSIVKSKRQTRTKRDIMKTYENILEEEYNVEKKGKSKKTLTNRLDDIESLLDQKIGGDDKTTKVSRSQGSDDVEELLNMKVEEKKEKSIIGDGGLKKCPFCGWSISKGAKKCPRCQKLLY
jgi:hypothetical protein